MEHNILVIDDEWDDRSPLYDKFAAEIANRYPNFNIVLVYQKKDDRADLMLNFGRNQYSAVISDAVLSGKWKNITIRDVVDIIDNKTPMAIVSSRWDLSNSQQMRHAWHKPNCRTFLHWRDIEGKGQIEYAIESVVFMLADKENLDPHLALAPGEELRIVHISDLHTKQVGSEKDTDAVQRIFNKAQACANAILNHWNAKPPAFIAFTGDVSEYGSPTQYEKAREWIQYFFKHLGLGELPARNILYVPGNHDVNLRLAASSRVALSIDNDSGAINPNFTDKDQQPEILNYAYVPFRNYLSKVSDCPLFDHNIDSNNFSWLEERFLHLGVIFYGLNTSVPTSSTLPERKVNVRTLTRLGEKLGEIKKNKKLNNSPIIIGLGHHSPVAEAEDGAVKNLQDFEEFFQGNGKTHIFLHGHCHNNIIKDTNLNDQRLIRSGAPSFSQLAKDRPEDTFRGFNLLTLSRRKNNITSLKVDSFGWIGPRLKCLETKSYEMHNGNFVEKYDIA
ncbi:metallophosphoesterase family protein, partial [Desulfocicer niacini]